MAVVAVDTFPKEDPQYYRYPTGTQIDVDNGTLVVSDADGKIVGLVNSWSEAHIVASEA
jgi:hypothetical protein